uniref:Astacin domain-containing protein n=1 Tax=Parastrongyloides trichosuri TaxID=131310 RepID=A0A0N4ZVV3_PARTI
MEKTFRKIAYILSEEERAIFIKILQSTPNSSSYLIRNEDDFVGNGNIEGDQNDKMIIKKESDDSPRLNILLEAVINATSKSTPPRGRALKRKISVEDIKEDVSLPLVVNDTNKLNTIEKQCNIETFLENAKKYLSTYDHFVDVKKELIYGFYTERSKSGIWIINENQSNYFNPIGHSFTKKRGRKYTDINCTTAYWCQNCRYSKKPQNLYGNALVEIKLKNGNIVSKTGKHHENCHGISFKHLLVNDCYRYAISIAKDELITPRDALKLSEGKLLIINEIFNYDLEDLKTIFKEYYKRGQSLKTALWRKH